MMRILFVLLVWLVGTACHGSGGSADAGMPWYSGGNGAGAGGAQAAVTNPSAPADDAAIAEYVRDWCGWYLRCEVPLYRDMNDCVEAMTCSSGGLLEDITITRGDLLGCSRSVVSLQCDALQFEVTTSCLQLGAAISGLFGEELGCGGAMCDAESYCDDDEPQCPRCVPRAALGEPCLGTRCVTGTYCDTTTQQCETLRTEGMACESQSACRFGTFGPGGWLRCRDGQCVKPSVLGEACEMPSDCELYLTCVNGVCGERKRVGESCTSLVNECTTSSYCLQGTCTRICGIGRQGIGDPCLADFHCDQSFCDPATSGCTAFKPQGAACTMTPECGAGFFCEPSSSTCAAVAADGAVCELHVGCMSGLCEEQRCLQPTCN